MVKIKAMNISKKARNKKNLFGVALSFGANLLLGLGKLIVGTVFGYISLTADAVNNLSDAVNNVVSFVSVKIAEKPADKEHPFGHERMEYVASTVVGIIVIILACEFAINSIQKIISNFNQPTLPDFDVIIIVMLTVSVVIKTFMSITLFISAKKYDLLLHRAIAVDSLSDAISSVVILISILLGRYFEINIDGYVGFVVSVVIFISGVKILKDTLNPLIGSAPNREETDKIKNTVLGFDGVLGVHDLIVHHYGPVKRFVTLHVETDAEMPIMEAHELADSIERLFAEDGIYLLVHLDPIVTNDQFVNERKQQVLSCLKTLTDFSDIHDFRVVYGKKNRLIFDVELNFGSKLTAEQITQKLQCEISQQDEYCISIDYV